MERLTTGHELLGDNATNELKTDILSDWKFQDSGRSKESPRKIVFNLQWKVKNGKSLARKVD